jgi:hypothetical protein
MLIIKIKYNYVSYVMAIFLNFTNVFIIGNNIHIYF